MARIQNAMQCAEEAEAEEKTEEEKKEEKKVKVKREGIIAHEGYE